MTLPIGDTATSARSAIEAALRRHADTAARVRDAGHPGSLGAESPAGAAPAGDFGEALGKGLDKLDSAVRGTEDLAENLISGKVEEFHEVALRLKQSELSFRFAMEVRNKLVDAYREVMRMSV